MSNAMHPVEGNAPSTFSNPEELHRVLFEQATDGIFIADPQLRFLTVNPRGSALIGYSSEELCGMRITDLIPAEDLVADPLRVDDLRQGRIVTRERRFHRKDGALLTMEVSVRMLAGGNFLGIVRDITARRATESFLRESETAYRALFRANPHPMYIYDLDTLAILEVNDAALTHYGFSRDEFLGMTIADIRPAEDLPRLLENLTHIGKKQLDLGGIWRHRKKDGTIIEVEIIGHVMDYFGRRAELILANDVTERRRAEQELRQREQNLRLLTDNMVDAISQIDAQRLIVYCSPSVERILALAPEELIGRDAHERVHPDDEPGLTDLALEAVSAHAQSYRVEYRYLHGRGDYVWVESSVRLLYDANGEYTGAILGSRDITERKLAERRLRESEERMRLSLAASRQGLFDLNVQTGEAKVSAEYAVILGHDPAEFHETDAAWIERLHPEDREAAVATYRDYLAGRIPAYQAEFRQLAKSGAWKWILSLGEIVERDARGAPLRMLGSYTDITERKSTEETLRQAKLVIENSPAVLFRWKAAAGWPVTMVTQNVRQFGYAPEELLSGAVPFLAMVHPEDADRVGREVREHSDAGADRFQQEYRIVARDGSVRWVDDRTVVERSAEGHILFYQGIVIDITERKRAEEALRESEREKDAILESMLDAFGLYEAVLDREGRVVDIHYLFVNEALEKMVGLTRDLVVGRTMRAIWPETEPEWIRRYGEVALTGKSQTFELYHGPTKKHYQCRIYRPWNASGRFCGTFDDITERRQAEEALRESELRFRAVFAQSSVGMVRADAQGTLQEVNLAFAAMLGRPAEELQGRPARDFTHPEDWVREQDLVRDMLRRGASSCRMEKRYLKPDGSIAWADLSVFTVRPTPTSPVLLIGMTMDITERRRAEKSVQESHNLLRTVLDTIPTRVFWKDRNLNYLGCNQPFADDAGFRSPDEVLGRDDYQMGWREQAELYRSADRLIMESGLPKLNYEESLTTPDGRQFWLHCSKVPLRNPDGTLFGVLGTYEDITPRKEIEDTLRREQEFIRALTENMLDGVVACDSEGKLALFNQTAREWHGLDPLRIPQEKWASSYNLFAEDGLTPLTLETVPLARAFRGERLIDAPLVIRAEGRPPRYVTCNCVPFYDGRGHLLGAVAVMRDLTETRRVQRVLAESEERFASFMRHLPGFAFLKDQNRRVLYVNEQFEAAFGFPLAHFLNRPTEEVWPGEVGERIRRDDEAVMAAGRPRAVVEEIPTGGELRTYRTIKFTIPRPDGRAWLGGISVDITELKRTEELLRSSLDEKESLLKEVHHRVKNTLQVISSLLNLQARRVTNLEVRAFLRDTQNRVGSMAMLHEILYHSGNLARISFPDYVKSLCALLGRSYGSDARRIRLKPEVADVSLSMDEAVPMGLIINELVSNAFKHAFPGRDDGEVLIQVRPEGDHRLQLRVADDGAGIPADRELQSEETLGLRLVHNLVRQLDGRMTISSDPGAVFQIVVPLRPVEGSSA